MDTRNERSGQAENISVKRKEKSMPRITVIEPTINPLTNSLLLNKEKRKVAAYARVSTDSDEQYTSYEAQVQYYTNYIQTREDWEYVETYADEGITGTNTKRRDNFKKMIEKALNGGIDLIITKSISRFARNTLDTISTVRELKAHHVEVFFEKENIWTFDPKSELIMTIMASIAQEESRSISQNVTWGKRVAFQQGKVSFAYSRFLGFKKGADGKIEIDEAEAEIVRRIYSMFLVEGMTCSGIAVALMKMGYKTCSGSSKWTKNGVYSILTNEKYKGDALLQKTYVEDYLEHKTVKNKGELPRYYVEKSHPFIIEPTEWDLVQLEMKRREALGAKYSSVDPFASKLICCDCGSLFGRKVWHSTDKYRRIIYRCNHKFDKKNDTICRTPSLEEEEIQTKFLKAYSALMDDREEILSNLEEVVNSTLSLDAIDIKIEDLKIELEVLEEKVKTLVAERGQDGSEKFIKKYEEVNNRFNKTALRISELKKERDDKLLKKNKLLSYIAYLRKQPEKIEVWNKSAWMVLVEAAIVNRDSSITFKFYDGSEVTID